MTTLDQLNRAYEEKLAEHSRENEDPDEMGEGES